MDWNEDPFEDLVNSFFGGRPQKRKNERFTQGEEEERNIDFIEDENFTHIVFEIPGYTKKDILVVIKGKTLEVSAKKSSATNIKEYLISKLQQGVSISKNLPSNVQSSKFTYTYKNGILEVKFNKK
ncbi:hypothetical protein COU54_03225 [Candidatus Pacearchaeota archaeon CG10_big_fil_rev_8_21_14_0_10_31_24]|nr:MAG: hypothetical protein COU54_03225 [Candidatus Pacearchaeota archaeon CG10_big_fil_rev_8_21_14_0_10_31_24]